jgi:hypothetical protein
VPTLTRLALGATAVTALTALGTAMPASAQSTPAAPPRTPTTTAPAASAVTAPAAPAAPAARTTPTRSTAHKPHAKRSRRTSTARRRSAARPAAAGTEHTSTAQTSTAHTSTSHIAATGKHRAVNRSLAPSAKRTPTHRGVTGGRTSQNWSGYTQSASELGRAVSSISASWQVPRAKQRVSGQAEAASDWVGISGSRASLIQAGTATTVGRAGIPGNYAWYETLPSAEVETPLATRSGDRLSVEIGRVGTDRWRIRMANATTGHTWSTSVRYAASGSSADFVTERPDTSAGPSTLPNRSATSFRHATVNGASTRFRPSQRVTMTDGRHALATPSGPEAKGDGFSVCSYASACGAGSR